MAGEGGEEEAVCVCVGGRNGRWGSLRRLLLLLQKVAEQAQPSGSSPFPRRIAGFL